ncbi:MAG: DNA-directed RNA polymerase subunit omega [Firmicutes bacterium]|nr:DNA-directed RNA polymerase subunit omega [Bacillota bacterium]MBQ5414650.1 DNA-directed RNA polymerase subunit omega [Bacillota bacterium]
MLLYPAIDMLKTKVDSKYTLTIMAAKRARDIIDGKPMLAISEVEKPISVATLEIAEDFISYKRDGE